MAAMSDGYFVTVAAKKIWDDPAYYYILLREDYRPTRATVEMEGLMDDAQSELEGADANTSNGGPDEPRDTPEYQNTSNIQQRGERSVTGVEIWKHKEEKWESKREEKGERGGNKSGKAGRGAAG
ncbi:hypothetical protein K435DRAFT_795919 [Dendrothele bispora CBS 962.96]|uniref:Uncharacterized protein n=1 Tax=Dendrothele bispora (strain CBS 962.96) TaxID=1314807 RepID=A0A4S8M7X4_DENBC|nr:hypothetical protein K435DRAFT_795919 [Dendrothele bispora CBS 962.96]